MIARTKPSNLETRRGTGSLVADKNTTKTKGPAALRGVAIVFNSLSEDLGGFREKVLPQAFDESLSSGRDVLALYSHQTEHLIGRLSNRSLEIVKRTDGLHVRIAPPDTTIGRDVATLIAGGYLGQMSFGFRVLDDSWDVVDKQTIRTVRKAELYEVSIVASPAYSATSITTGQATNLQPKRSSAKAFSGPSNLDRLRKLRLMEAA